MTDPQPPAPALARHDGRALDELRPGFFVRDYTEFAAGSVLAVSGRTKVLCTASIDEDAPASVPARDTDEPDELDALPGHEGSR